MQIGGKCIESLLMNMVFEKKTLKRHKFEQFSMPLLLGMGYTNSNLELSNLQ
jgi:hypothetical protein